MITHLRGFYTLIEYTLKLNYYMHNLIGNLWKERSDMDRIKYKYNMYYKQSSLKKYVMVAVIEILHY